MKSTHGGCETSFLLSKFVYKKSYLSTIYKKRRKKYSANLKNQAMEKRKLAASRGSSSLDDRGTCASLPFHVTSGQPPVGQGVDNPPGRRVTISDQMR
ncbi:unnamed protein product [Spirodela intermedia]|uniref:Uncharacterized protein n=1 Tax=Spirodela intermedia TaxID=51605 RepID=A0ABN7EDN6_SPIIN|nr:unnamed protein product [Spirodela intermedia]